MPCGIFAACPRRPHTTATSTLPHLSTGSESTHEPKSAAVTKTPYQVASKRPGRFTARRRGFYDSVSYCSFTSFHLDVSLSSLFLLPHSLCSLNSILAASASKLSSQSSQNDYNLGFLLHPFPILKTQMTSSRKKTLFYSF